MSVYVTVSYDIHDFETFQKYPPRVAELLPKYKGKVLAMDPSAKTMEGAARMMNVIVEFPSEKEADGFYYDPEYRSFIHLRHDSTSNCTMVMVKQFVKE